MISGVGKYVLFHMYLVNYTLHLSRKDAISLETVDNPALGYSTNATPLKMDLLLKSCGRQQYFEDAPLRVVQY